MVSRLPIVGVQALLAGAAQYIRDAQGVNGATAAMANQAERSAQQTHAAVAGTREDTNELAAALGGLSAAFGGLLGPFQELAHGAREFAEGALEGARALIGGGGLTGALIGVTAAGAAAITTFIGLGVAGAEWAQGIQQITSITGLSQEQAELYGTALKLVGGDEQALVRTSFLLERQLQGTAEAIKAGQHPSSELTRALQTLGVQWRDTTGNVREMGNLLPEIIERLGTLDDAQLRGALSAQIFGRYGIEVTRFIEHYNEVLPAAQQITEEFSTEQFDAARLALEYQKTLARLGQAFEFLAVRALPPFLALANRVVDAITGWVSTHGEDFVNGLSNAVLSGAHAIELLANGFGAVLGPAVGAAADALSAFGSALSKIPTPVIEWILRLAGAAAGIILVASAIGVASAAVTVLTASLVSLSVAAVATPAGWIAIAAALGLAAGSYLIVRKEMEAAKRAAEEEAEGKRLAQQATLDSLRAQAAEASTRRELLAAQLNNLGSSAEERGAAIALQKEIDDLDGKLRTLARGIEAAGGGYDRLAESARATNKAIGDGKTVFELMGLGAATTAEDVRKLSSELITAKILAENLRNLPEGTDPFEVVNSQAFREQIKVVLNAYQQARREAEAAAKANELLVNAAGYLTDAQKSAAESAARAAERAAEEFARAAAKMVEDAQNAAERIRKAQVAQLDQLGDLVTEALRARYAEQLRITEESYNEQRRIVEETFDARAEAAKRSSDEQIRAIDASTAALIAGINAQIAALRGMDEAEDRTDLVRKVALSYDPKERAEAEKDLRSFDRRVQINALQAQAQTIQEQARLRKQQIEDDTKARLEAIERERDAADKTFDLAEKAAQETYRKQTEAFTLESEARRLVMDNEQQGYVQDMITKYAPQWQTAGISFGQQLLTGIRAQIEPYLRSLQNLIPGTGGGAGGRPGGGGGPSAADVSNAAYIAALQQQGQAAAAGGAPGVALDTLRQNVINAGSVPSFDRGLDWGRVPKPMLAQLHTGEVVLTPEQQAEYMGTRFERGAFDGMFNGAHFNGSPEDNARAIRTEFESLINQQLGRGAFLHGV